MGVSCSYWLSQPPYSPLCYLELYRWPLQTVAHWCVRQGSSAPVLWWPRRDIAEICEDICDTANFLAEIFEDICDIANFIAKFFAKNFNEICKRCLKFNIQVLFSTFVSLECQPRALWYAPQALIKSDQFCIFVGNQVVTRAMRTLAKTVECVSQTTSAIPTHASVPPASLDPTVKQVRTDAGVHPV